MFTLTGGAVFTLCVVLFLCGCWLAASAATEARKKGKGWVDTLGPVLVILLFVGMLLWLAVDHAPNYYEVGRVEVRIDEVGPSGGAVSVLFTNGEAYAFPLQNWARLKKAKAADKPMWRVTLQHPLLGKTKTEYKFE